MKENKILITGGSGMLGFALKELIPDSIFIFSKQYDLRYIYACESMFEIYKPEYIIHLAAKVGGVKANKENLADFYRDNILINTNVLECARKYKVKKLISVLSTCIYPDKIKYPLKECNLHNGEPHKSNYAYAYVKRMLDVHSRALRDQYNCNFITVVPNNLFGPNDQYDLNNSHVLPAIMRKIHEAKIKNEIGVQFWGTGETLREFTYSKDIAKILLFILENYNDRYPINIGDTNEISIKSLVYKICKIIDYKGQILWDHTKPNGQLRKSSNNF